MPDDCLIRQNPILSNSRQFSPRSLIRLACLRALSGSIVANLGTIYRVAREVKARLMKTGNRKAKTAGKERDLFRTVSDALRIFARRSSIALGSAWAFAGAMLVILVWVSLWTNVSFFRYLAVGDKHWHDNCHLPHGISDQNTQNRDAKAVHLKLDELIRAQKRA